MRMRWDRVLSSRPESIMKRFRNILVVVTDTLPGDSAFEWLNCIATAAEVDGLDFLVVHEDAGVVLEPDEQAEAAKAEWIKDLGHACTGRLEGISLDLLEKTGQPLREALHQLADGAYDLVVVPVEGRKSRILAERLARKSPVGVLMLPEPAVVPPGRVIAALDFSELTALVIDWAEAFATLCTGGAELVAVHVVDPTIEARASAIREESKLQRDIRRTAEWQLQESLGGHARDAGKWSSSLIDGQLAGAALADHLESDGDLLVVGNHGRNALTLALMGSNTADLLRSSRKPVLVVKQKNRSLGFLRQLLGMEA